MKGCRLCANRANASSCGPLLWLAITASMHVHALFRGVPDKGCLAPEARATREGEQWGALTNGIRD
jgi:hypothetical protein